MLSCPEEEEELEETKTTDTSQHEAAGYAVNGQWEGPGGFEHLAPAFPSERKKCVFKPLIGLAINHISMY